MLSRRDNYSKSLEANKNITWKCTQNDNKIIYPRTCKDGAYSSRARGFKSVIEIP